MLKSILGVVAGYLVMFAVAFAAYTAAYFALGSDRVFDVDTYVISGIWIGVIIVVTFVAGLVGGLTCAAISKSPTAGLVLALVVFVLGFVFELPNIMKDHTPAARAGEVSIMEVMEKSQPPAWLCLINPFVGGAAVLIGTRMKKSAAV